MIPEIIAGPPRKLVAQLIAPGSVTNVPRNPAITSNRSPSKFYELIAEPQISETYLAAIIQGCFIIDCLTKRRDGRSKGIRKPVIIKGPQQLWQVPQSVVCGIMILVPEGHLEIKRECVPRGRRRGYAEQTTDYKKTNPISSLHTYLPIPLLVIAVSRTQSTLNLISAQTLFESSSFLNW